MHQVQQTNYDLLAAIVSARLRETGLSLDILADRLYSQPGYNLVLKSAKAPLRYFAMGCIYGTPSNRPSNPEKGLWRLAIFLYALGVSETDPVISGLKEIDSRFQYPPESQDNITRTLTSLRELLGQLDPRDYKQVLDYLTGLKESRTPKN